MNDLFAPEQFFEKVEWRDHLSPQYPNKEKMWGFKNGEWFETVYCRFKKEKPNEQL